MSTENNNWILPRGFAKMVSNIMNKNNYSIIVTPTMVYNTKNGKNKNYDILAEIKKLAENYKLKKDFCLN